MKEIHWFYAPDFSETAELPTDETAHALRVLRLREDDPLCVTDGKGCIYEAHIGACSKNHCEVCIDRTTEVSPQWEGNIQIGIAPTKNMDRMEWLAEKATEIGWNRISFINCKNSERKVIKTERIEKIIVAATKQSHKAYKPKVDEMCDFKTFVNQPFDGEKYIAHCLCETDSLPHLNSFPLNGNTLVLIGPEGDFTIEEVKLAEAAGFRSISLGKSRLRTETAALFATTIMNLKKS